MTSRARPDIVRLGDITLLGNKETTRTFGIKNIIRHPNYKFSSKYDDIALIELDKTVG